MALFSDVKIDFFVNTKAALRAIDDFRKNVRNSFETMKNNVAGQLGGLATAYFGIKALKGVYDETLKLVNLSEKWRLPVENVSKFANTLSMFGGGTEEAISNIESLERAITDLKTTGSGALKTVANQIGLSVYNTDGSIKNSIQIMDDLRLKFKALNKDGQIKVAEELGLSSPATLRMLRASDEEYKQLQKDANKFGVINEKTAKNMIKFQRTIAKLKQSFKSLAGSTFQMLQPIIDKIAKGMEWLANQSDGVKMAIVGIGAGIPILQGLLPIISGLLTPLKLVGSILKGFIPIIKSIGAIFISNPLIAIITAIAMGAYLIIDNWKEVKEFFIKLFDYILAGFEKVKEVWNGVKDSIGELWDGAKNKVKDAWNSITNFFTGDEDDKIATQYFPTPTEIPPNSSINNNSNSTTTNTTNNNNVNISNVNISTQDGTDAGKKFLNIINSQNASGVIY